MGRKTTVNPHEHGENIVIRGSDYTRNPGAVKTHHLNCCSTFSLYFLGSSESCEVQFRGTVSTWCKADKFLFAKGRLPPRNHKQRNTTVYILHPESNHILAFLKKKSYLRLVFIRTKAKHPVTVQTSNKWGLAKYSQVESRVRKSNFPKVPSGQEDSKSMDSWILCLGNWLHISNSNFLKLKV